MEKKLGSGESEAKQAHLFILNSINWIIKVSKNMNIKSVHECNLKKPDFAICCSNNASGPNWMDYLGFIEYKGADHPNLLTTCGKV